MILRFFLRLFENVKSIFEGAWIAFECWILGILLGLGWIFHEWYDSWSVPLTQKYRDEIDDDTK